MTREAQDIISEIFHHVQSSFTPEFGFWRIGRTSDVPKVYEKWGCPCRLVHWAAVTLTDAQAMESYFVSEKNIYYEETCRR